MEKEEDRKQDKPLSECESKDSQNHSNDSRCSNPKVWKPSGPKLNTWDVPEWLPGAMPRANPVQKAYFESRSIKVHEYNTQMDVVDEEAQVEHENGIMAERLESDLSTLRDLFPDIDFELIQESYLTNDCDMDSCVEELLAVSVPDGAPPPRRDPPMGERAFPSLTDSDGWEVLPGSPPRAVPDYRSRLLH
jgi:hypothetical protein